MNWILLAQAIPSPTPTPLSSDQISQMLANALQVAAGVPGIIGALLVALIGIAIAVIIVANYFSARGAREAAAYQTALQIAQTQEANLSQMQSDAAQALINNMDAVYQQDYDYFLAQITAANYQAVYAKLAPQFATQIAGFIYDSTVSAPQKAARIILLMKAAATT